MLCHNKYSPVLSTNCNCNLILQDSCGGLSLSSLAGWNDNSKQSVEKMIAMASEGGGGGGVPVVYSEDQVMTESKIKDMEAKIACTKDDVLCRSWLIRFVNSQMLLKGCETRGEKKKRRLPFSRFRWGFFRSLLRGRPFQAT